MILLLLVIFIGLVILIAKSQGGSNDELRKLNYIYHDDCDDYDDMLLYREMMYEEYKDCDEDDLLFYPPDPYSMSPEELMYLDCDGEILEDL